MSFNIIPPQNNNGITDGNKGDLTVSNNGDTWVLNNGVVTLVKTSITGTPDGSKVLKDDFTLVPLDSLYQITELKEKINEQKETIKVLIQELNSNGQINNYKLNDYLTK